MRIKLALAVIGLILFAAGVRLDNQVLRWTGIGFVVAAFLMRFVQERR